MALNAIYSTQEDIPENYRELFQENSEGKFEIQVVGVKTQADVDRVQNSLEKERGETKKAKERLAMYTALGEDPEEIQARLDHIAELEAGQGEIDEDKLNQLAEARAAKQIAPKDREIKKLNDKVFAQDQQLSAVQTKLNNYLIDAAANAAAASEKMRVEAQPDFLLFARSNFVVDENENVITSEKSQFGAGLSAKEVLKDLKETRPHWWPDSEGGGAGGSGTKLGGENPWAEKTLNLTRQGEIFRENPERARMLAKAAGKTL